MITDQAIFFGKGYDLGGLYDRVPGVGASNSQPDDRSDASLRREQVITEISAALDAGLIDLDTARWWAYAQGRADAQH